MKKVLIKDTIYEIKSSKKRFISILLILLLGTAIFAGINSVCPNMKIAADKYYNEQNLMDFRLLSTYGITKEDIKDLNNMEEVKGIMSSYSFDSIIKVDEKEIVTKINTVPKESLKNNDENYINRLKILDGENLKNPNECIVEENFLEMSGLNIGDKIKVKPEKAFEDKLIYDEFVIVGTAITPYYMTLDKGVSSLGEGKVNSYVYILEDGIKSAEYTEVFVTINRDLDYNTYSDRYIKLVNGIQKKVEDLTEFRKDVRYEEILEEGNKKISEAKFELNNKTNEANKEILLNEKKLQNGKNELINGEKEIISNEEKLNNEFLSAKKKLDNADKELSMQEKEFANIKKDANKQFDITKKTVADINNLRNADIAQKNKNANEINILANEVKNKNIEIEKLKIDLESASESDKIIIQRKIDGLINETNALLISIRSLYSKNYIIDEKVKKYDENISNITSEVDLKTKEIKTAESKLILGREELNNQKYNLEKGQKAAIQKISEAKIKLETSKKEIEENENKINEAKEELIGETKKAEEKIENAQDELSKLKEPKYYVLGRDKLQCYVQYEQDANRIAALAIVFPTVFFLVAALVSLTSMTRMIEEQRQQIGTLKSLGYNKIDIASKYLWYATLAAIIGSLIGVLIGSRFIPMIVFKVYNIIYTMPETYIDFNIMYASMAIIISLICTTIATLMACMSELRLTPASLMRPKSPKMGKRVFLEKINLIWQHLSFTQKVTARNIFRYKKRLFMTVLGISGCTALLLAAFGLKDSVLSIAPLQYEKIFKYDLQISIKDKLPSEQISETEEFLNSQTDIQEHILSRNEAIKSMNNGISKDVQLITLKSELDISKYINLKSRTKKEMYTLENNSVIITEQLAKILKIKKGDFVNLKFNEEDEPVNIKVSGVAENYIGHYVYISDDLYTQIFNKNVSYNNCYANVGDNIDDKQLISKLLKYESLTNATSTQGISEIYEESMKSLNYVVLVLIISAGMLALIVLYNLSNVNISERKRELATIKVLGFYDKEVSSYVDRESIILTLIGIVLGLIFGQILNYFIITTCESDFAMLGRSIKPISYVFAVVITICFSVAVNILTYFSLKKIDMIESLKSVE